MQAKHWNRPSLHGIFTRFRGNPSTRRLAPGKPSRKGPPRPLVLEALESRTLLSVLAVDRLTDNHLAGGGEGAGQAGDLRYCLTNAADGDVITFSSTCAPFFTAMGPGPSRRAAAVGTGG
jgi:hypothetical protein